MQAGNLYAFTMHNPIRWLDPTGLSAISASQLASFREGVSSAGGTVSVLRDGSGNIVRMTAHFAGNAVGSISSGGGSSSMSMAMMIVPVPTGRSATVSGFPVHVQPRASQISGFPSDQQILEAFRNAGMTLGYAARNSLGGQFIQDVIGFPSSIAELYRLILTSTETTGNAANNAGASSQSRNNLPSTRAELHNDLTNRGFVPSPASSGGYVVYRGPNGARVTIKPTGEVIPTQRVPIDSLNTSWNSPMRNQRIFYDGTPVPNSGHSTGHFVEPFRPPGGR